MDTSALLVELFGRIPLLAHRAVDGLPLERLLEQPGPGRNPIAWLIWHLARVEDDHFSEIAGEEQLWVTGEFARHFGLEPDPSNTGYGHGPEEVASVRPDSTGALFSYLDAVGARVRALLEKVTDDELDRVVDESYDPPVTMGVRLVSVASDSLQHVGQAAYIRGLLEAS